MNQAPASTYWCLAEPGHQYVVYIRGVKSTVTIRVDDAAKKPTITRIDPRTGEKHDLGAAASRSITFDPLDEKDWVVIIK